MEIPQPTIEHKEDLVSIQELVQFNLYLIEGLQTSLKEELQLLRRTKKYDSEEKQIKDLEKKVRELQTSWERLNLEVEKMKNQQQGDHCSGFLVKKGLLFGNDLQRITFEEYQTFKKAL